VAREERGDLPGIDAIVLGLASVDGFHIEGMAELEDDAVFFARVSQPVPEKDALTADDDVLLVWSNGGEE